MRGLFCARFALHTCSPTWTRMKTQTHEENPSPLLGSEWLRMSRDAVLVSGLSAFRLSQRPVNVLDFSN